jgi:hypothetical protein
MAKGKSTITGQKSKIKHHNHKSKIKTLVAAGDSASLIFAF